MQMFIKWKFCYISYMKINLLSIFVYVEICYIRTHFATCSPDPNYHILGVSSIKCHHMQCTELMENLDVFVNIQCRYCVHMLM